MKVTQAEFSIGCEYSDNKEANFNFLNGVISCISEKHGISAIKMKSLNTAGKVIELGLTFEGEDAKKLQRRYNGISKALEECKYLNLRSRKCVLNDLFE